jgi:hypothetical protein
MHIKIRGNKFHTFSSGRNLLHTIALFRYTVVKLYVQYKKRHRVEHAKYLHSCSLSICLIQKNNPHTIQLEIGET